MGYPWISSLTRWGSSGFSFIAPGNSPFDQEVYILSSSLSRPLTQNPQPTIASISPASAGSGGAAFTLTVNGTGFVADSVVNWGQTHRATTYVSSTQLTAAISAADISDAGSVYVGVESPTPGGGASTLLTFTITPPPGELTVSPGALSFTSSGLGAASAAQQVTIQNSGTQPVSIASVSATNDFTETDSCAGVLSPAATCQVSVTFTPTATNAETGTLTITDTAASSPQTVALSGSATAAITIAPASGGSTTSTVRSGQTATYNLSLTGTPGLTGTVSLTCSGAPTGATCIITPASLNLVSGQASNFTVSVSTTGNATSAVAAQTSIGALGLLSMLSFPLFLRRRSAPARLFLAIALLAGGGIATLSGCGSGKAAQNTPPPTQTSGVAPGTYSLNLVATDGSLSITQSLSLIVK